MAQPTFVNPFRPGAGHPPPYLAGRSHEQAEFDRLLQQDRILENCILTGLRGVGKTVLLDTLKPRAQAARWLWVGTDLSESTSVSEDRIATRIITDLAVVTSSFAYEEDVQKGFNKPEMVSQNLTFDFMAYVYNNTPGLVSDRLKTLLSFVWESTRRAGPRGIVFAYDEAQNLADHAPKEEYPLSLLLDVFQSLQRQGYPLMLVLTGLPTLFPKLVEARTFSERMFHSTFLDRLDEKDCRDAILKPIEGVGCPVTLDDGSIQQIVNMSAGYPYFIQFICREVFDTALARLSRGEPTTVPAREIEHKLDNDFFAGRWGRATDRQRQLLYVIASLPNSDEEFSVQDTVTRSKEILEKPFSSSHTNQMLVSLANAGLVYKNRHGRYSFAVPLLGRFILRQDVEVARRVEHPY